MTEPGPDRLFSLRGRLALAAVLIVAVCSPAVFSQTTLRGGVSQTEYTDEYARTCQEQNKNNPYAGMNPFVCHGEMAPTDSQGQCSLNIGTVWKKDGNTCYYCAPINPPIEGMVLPLDQVASAESQGWGCGANQTDACTAICYGGKTYSPPPGVTVVGGGPGLPPTPKPAQGGPPPGYAPQPGPPPVAGASPSGSDFGNQLLADAQTILQNAGKISKEMTDAMDVTKHNNVGIGVALGAYFGAAGKLLGVVAQQYKLLAAAGSAVAAAEKTPILQIANEAASQSATLAGEAEEAAAEIAKTGGAAAGTAMGSGAANVGYLEGIVLESGSTTLPAQGALPTCAVLSCARVSDLLGRNVGLMRVMDKIRPRLSLTKTGDIVGGLTAQEVETGLKSIGINAQVGSGMTNMMNQVRAGNPVIAGVYTTTASGTAPLHAIVIEGVEERLGVSGLKIYDPRGWVYWQPTQTFQKYFSQQFVMPI